MTKEKFEIEEIAHQLDNTSGAIGTHAEVLSDIEINFMQVVEEMDNAVYRGDEQAYYREHHRELRILSQLLHHVMGGISKDHAELRSLSHTLFSETVKKESASGEE